MMRTSVLGKLWVKPWRVIRRASRLDVQQHFKENILGSIRRVVPTRNQLCNFCGHVSCLSSLEPLKVYDAIEYMDWVAAMHEELNKFEHNQVWSLVERPKDTCHKVIGTKWVFKNKLDSHGQVIRNKARLVAQGLHKSKESTTVKLMTLLLDLNAFAY